MTRASEEFQRMKNLFPFLFLALFLLSFFFYLTLAENFEASVTQNSPSPCISCLEPGIENFIKISINNTDASLNITQVNITLPSGFGFVKNSNGTTANESSSFSCIEPNLTWSNISKVGFIKNGTEEFFWFNVTVPQLVNGTQLNLTVTVKFTDGSVNSTNLTFTIYDTIPPNYEHLGSNLTTTPHRGETFLFYANWSDNSGAVGLGNATLETNVSGSWKVESTKDLNESCTWSNFTWMIPTSVNVGTVVAVRIRANDTANNTNVTASFTFTVWGYSKSLVFLKENATHINVSCRVIDATNSSPIANYPVKIYNITPYGETLLAEGLSDSDGWFNYTWKKVVGKYNLVKFSCSISDNSSLFYNVTEVANQTVRIFLTANTTFGNYTITNLLEAHATLPHRYFVNASSVENSTFIWVNLTWNNCSKDLDLFLLNSSGGLIEFSVSKEGCSESLLVRVSDEVLEIRVYGNVSTSEHYTLELQLSTINFTNTSTNEFIDIVDFGKVYLGNISRTNFTVKNVGNLNFTIRKFQTSSLPNSPHLTNLGFYREYVFNGVESKNYTFLFPEASIGVIALLTWDSNDSYELRLYSPSDVLVTKSSSQEKASYFSLANVSKNMTFLRYSTPPSHEAGVWKVEVRNLTRLATGNKYELEILVFYPEDNLVATNFTSASLNETSSSCVVSLNLSSNLTSGRFYYAFTLAESNENVPVAFLLFTSNTSSAEFVVMNRLERKTLEMSEDIGFNRTIRLEIPINNTGNAPLEIKEISCPKFLNHSSDTKAYVGISCSQLSLPYELPANGGVTLEVNLTFNKSSTNGFKEGIYSGVFNFSVNSSAISATFNLTVKVNLTSRLLVKILFIQPEVITGDQEKNVSLTLDIRFANSSIISPTLVLQNFTDPYMKARDVPSYVVNPTISSVHTSGSLYKVNVTISPSPGNNYTICIGVNYKVTNSSIILSGSDCYRYLTISNPALLIYDISKPSTMYNSSSSTVRVYIKSYGNRDTPDPAQIRLQETTGLLKNITKGDTTCSATFDESTDTWKIYYKAGNTTTCYVSWKIESGKSTGTASLKLSYPSHSHWWFNKSIPSFSITIEAPSEEEEEEFPPPEEEEEQPTYVVELEFVEAPSLVLVVQNATNTTTVVVKNAGNKTVTVYFTIENITSDWFALNDSSEELSPGEKAAFKILFNVGNAEIGDYEGKYKASCSEKVVRKSFTLRVLPSEKKKEEINSTIAVFKQNYSSLVNETSELESLGYDVSKVKDLLNKLEKKIENAESFVKAGDYISAYQLFDSIKSLIGQIHVELQKVKKAEERKPEEEKKAKGFPWGIVIPALCGIFAAIILAYLFWPSEEGFQPQKKRYVPPKRRKFSFKRLFSGGELEEKWKKLYQKYSKSRK